MAEVHKFLSGQEFLRFYRLVGEEFTLDEGILNAAVSTGGFALAEAREGINEAEVEFRFGAESVGKGFGLKGEEEFIELSGSDGAASVLNGDEIGRASCRERV